MRRTSAPTPDGTTAPTRPLPSRWLSVRLRESLRAALVESYGELPQELDLDEFGVRLVDTIAMVIDCRMEHIHRSSSLEVDS